MIAPQIHHVRQRSEEWHALRARHFCASDAPAMMEASPYQSRADLLRAKALGIEREHDAATEMRFRNGHAAEEAFRPHAERLIGDELFPAVMTAEVEGLPLLASLDGLTIDGATAWEHKAYNEAGARAIATTGEPPMQYVWQLEHQLLVSGAQRAYFTFSDGTPDLLAACWYESKPERRAALIAGWRQFAVDLEAARQKPPQQAAEPVQAKPVPGFGALVLRVEGRVVASNLDAFRIGAEEFLARLPKASELQADQDFADAEQAVKACAEAEDRIRAAKEQAIAQMADIDAVLRTADQIAESIRAARLALDKAVRARKDAIRAELIQDAARRVLDHYAAIAAEMGEYAPQPPVMLTAELGAAIKGLKTVASIRDRLDGEVARAKIDADELARFARANMAIVRAAIEQHGNLWPDAPRLCRELSEEALRGVIAARVEEWRRREQEKERARATAQVPAMPAAQPAVERAGAEPALLKLGEIATIVAPLRIDAAGLKALGAKAAKTRGAAKLYSVEDVRAALWRYCQAMLGEIRKI